MPDVSIDAVPVDPGPIDTVSIDTDQVAQVVDFYRQAAEVVSSTSEDLRSHRFGTWVIGEDYRELGDRFVAMTHTIADRLAEQSAAAARLSEELARAAAIVTTADADAADQIRRADRRW